MSNQLLTDLAKAKAIFQQRAVLAALGVNPGILDAAETVEAVAKAIDPCAYTELSSLDLQSDDYARTRQAQAKGRAIGQAKAAIQAIKHQLETTGKESL